LVDGERVQVRLARLERLIEQLEAIRAQGREKFLADEDLRTLAERRLQLAEQISIDLGAQIVSERSARPPSDYAEIFLALAEAGDLDRALAEQMAAAARQRNVLVHLYLDIDPDKVWDALAHLDDFRQFAAAVQRLLDEEPA